MKKLIRLFQIICFLFFVISISCTGRTDQGKTMMKQDRFRNQDQNIILDPSMNQDRPNKGLILTGHHHPDHPWQETTPVIKEALEQDDKIQVDVSTNIEDLSGLKLRNYDFLVLNYCNWEKPEGLSNDSKKAFVKYLNKGGGLLIIHFANGAWHYSLPGAEASDWPEFRKICRRMWDHQGNSAHDAYDTFRVDITTVPHFITESITSFETIDELYYNQSGDEPIEPLLMAHSKNTGKDEPLAWVYNYGKGRVFQLLPGHNAASFNAPEIKKMLQRSACWVSKKD